MSTMNRPGISGAQIMNKLSVECPNLGKSIKFSSGLALIMVSIALLFLVASILYEYLKKVEVISGGLGPGEIGNAPAPHGITATKKRKVVGGLAITSAVILFLSMIISVYQFAISSKNVNNCIRAN